MMLKATYKRKSRLLSATKRYRGKVLSRTMAPTSVAKDLTRSKRVQFSSVDTIHTFDEKSTSLLPATGKSMSQDVEMEKPKTSEYRYFKKLKRSNQNIPCLRSSKSGIEIEKRELHNYHSGMCNQYGTIFHYKRQKLQELAEKALSLERGDLVLFGSKPIVILLQRLEILSDSNIGTASQKKVLETTDTPIGIEKRALQSNFQPETYSSLDTKYGFEKVCIPLDISSDAQELKHVSRDIKFSGIKTSVFHDADYLSLISPSKVNEVQQGGSDVYEWGHHNLTDFDFGTDSVSNGQQLAQGIDFNPESILDTRYLQYPYSLFCKSCSFDNGHKWTSKDLPSKVNEVQQGDSDGYEWGHHDLTDFDFGTDSISNGQQLAQGIDFNPESILDTRYLPYPYSFFCKSCSFDNDHKWTSKDFPPFLDLQSNRCHVFESLHMKMNNLGSISRDIIKYKPKNSSFMKDITMQLLDHEDEFKDHRQEFLPEMGMILCTSPKNNFDFELLLDHEDKNKHYKKEFIPQPGVMLWGPPNKGVFFNLKCDKNEDFYLQATSQTSSPTISLWNNDRDSGPDLGFSFSSIEPHYGTGNWKPRESLSYLLSREMDLLEGHNNLHGNTDDFPYMNVNEQYCSMQTDGQEVPGFYNLPYNSSDRKNFYVKLNCGLENAFNIPDIDFVRERRWESSALSIYHENIEMMQP